MNPTEGAVPNDARGAVPDVALQPPETLPEHEGAEAILWLTTDKGFEDISARSYLKDGSWYWADSDEIIKRQDFIKGWLPWPEPPDARL